MIKKIILLLMLFPTVVFAASIVNDFDAGYDVTDLSGIGHIGIRNNTTNSGYENSPGGIWVYETDRTHGDDPQIPYTQTTNCVDGNCMRVDIGSSATSCNSTGDAGNFYLYIYSTFVSKPILDQAADADRLTAYVAIPPDYPESNYYTMHVGTYTKDTTTPDGDSGPHYYHWFGLIGSNYYSKIIINQHPQAEVGSEVDPGVNPQTWDYLSNLYRFYLDASFCSPLGEYSAYFDEIQFEDIAPAVDDAENVASIACSYIGAGEYRIVWYRNTHSTEYSGHTYSVRWANAPITTANYSEATLVSNTIVRTPSANETTDAFEVNFTIAKTSGTVYFGIYDETANNGLVTAFDYIIAEAPYLSNPTYTQPTITITSPIDGGSTTQSTVTVSGTATKDAALTITGVSVNGTAATSGDGFATWTATGVSLNLGSNTITATVTDSESQTGQDSISYTRDATSSNTIITGAVITGATIK